MNSSVGTHLLAPHNYQMQRTVEMLHVRPAGASFHYAPTSRWTCGRAAADLERYATAIVRVVCKRPMEEPERKRKVNSMRLLLLTSILALTFSSGVGAQDLPFPPDYLERMANLLARCSGIEAEMAASFQDGGELAQRLPKAAGANVALGLRGKSESLATAAARYLSAWIAATGAVPLDETELKNRIEQIVAAGASDMRAALATGESHEYVSLAKSCERL